MATKGSKVNNGCYMNGAVLMVACLNARATIPSYASSKLGYNLSESSELGLWQPKLMVGEFQACLHLRLIVPPLQTPGPCNGEPRPIPIWGPKETNPF